jgi:hypothetical protein
MVKKILHAINKFDLSLKNKVVLTEAASGNYVVTSVIAALAGAKVVAIAKESKYATVNEIRRQTFQLAKKFKIQGSIKIVENEEIDLSQFDIVTNTGHVRPIDQCMVKRLKKTCVIPLMWETWEYRKEDLDLDACMNRGIKVYGTNESDARLRTLEYIGYTVLYLLLDRKYSPFSVNILLLGCSNFSDPIIKVLIQNNYTYTHLSEYDSAPPELDDFDVIVIAEHSKSDLLVGNNGFIHPEQLEPEKYVIHICGNVQFDALQCRTTPEHPASFGYMSYTTDYIDNQSVVDLHTAGLKVAEGMLKANDMHLDKDRYKIYMEKNYPAMSFRKKIYW